MGRACKCRYCQTNTKTNDAVMFMIGKLKAYFCNEEHYNLFIKEKEEAKQRKAEETKAEKQRKKEEEIAAVQKRKQDKNKVYYLICEIVGRKEIINTILWKEWALWNKVATNEQIGLYLEENKDYLISVISRLDNVEHGRIKYLSAVLKNKLGDYNPKQIVKETAKPKVKVDETFYEAASTASNKRRSLADLEEDF